ncbi:hypothetical protein LIER_25049 [Lithospermum erythrorhizon]|uniref:Transposase n=1 Tax=Lithospermum erythrorhizon TaxID=34254 RepID=A0AAV3R7C4_LITER
MFTNKKQAKEAITCFAFANKKPLACYVDDSRRMKFKCKLPCKWVVWLSKSKRLDPNDFMIKTMSTKHKNCPQKRTKFGNSNFLAVAFEDIIRVMPNIKIPALQVVVKMKFSIRISADISRRKRDSARRKIEGDHVGQFNRLWDYNHELKKSHPRSRVLINYEQERDANGDHKFKRIYVCLRPLVEDKKKGLESALREK